MRLIATACLALALSSLGMDPLRAAPKRDSVDYWIAQLRAGDPIAREAAAHGLTLSGRRALPAVGALRAALADPVPEVRTAACEALGGLGSDAAQAATELATILADDASAEVRAAAAAALADVGPGAAVAVPALLRALRAEPDDARALAAETLGRVGGSQPRVIAALEHVLLRDEARGARVSARAALDRLGHDEPALAPLFIRALDDDDPVVRERAAAWLQNAAESASTASGVGRLAFRATQDPVPEVRRAASDALSALGARATSAVPLLLADLAHAEPERRAQAAKLLGRVGAGSEAEIHALTRVLVFDPALAVRRAARASIVRLARTHPLVVMDLAGLLTSDDENMAREAAETLGALGDDAGAAAEALGRAVTTTAEPVRHASVLALGQLGETAIPEIPQLELATRDRSDRVKAAARRAIKALHEDGGRAP